MNTKRFLVFTLLLAAGYLALISLKIEGILPLDRSLAQLLVFPFAVLALYRANLFGSRVPLTAVSFACLGAGASLSFTFIFSLNERGGVVLASLKDDELQKQTRIFRELVNKHGAHSQLALRDTSVKIEHNNQADEFLAKRPRLAALAWGSDRWLNISLKPSEPVTLAAWAGVPAIAGFDRLMLPVNIRMLGVSLQPSGATAGFLADLFEGLAYAERSDDPLAHARQDIALAAAGSYMARWTNLAHRAYPWWLLGNRYLNTAIGSGGMQSAPLKCALKAYKNARGLIRRNDNRDLLAAVHNNTAIAYYAQYIFTGRKVYKKQALKNLRFAVRSLAEKNTLGVEAVSARLAAENMGIILSYRGFSKQRPARLKDGKRAGKKAKSAKKQKKPKMKKQQKSKKPHANRRKNISAA